MNLNDLLKGLEFLFQVNNILLIVGGTLVGTTVGFLPGMGASLPIALLLPVTFVMRPDSAMMLLVAIFCGSMYGGSISAILFNIPGTGSAAATALDGYPLALQGKAGEALLGACMASFMGGIIGGLCLLFFAPLLARFALKFGPPEYATLGVFALTIIASFSRTSLIKGLIAGVFGMFLGTIGMDPITGYFRFTFGRLYLFDGIHLVWAIIGLFGLSQAFLIVQRTGSLVALTKIEAWDVKGTALKVLRSIGNVVRSALIGMMIGAIPGPGGSIGCWVAYGEAKKFSPRGKEFGEGVLDGVLAAEAANNASVGGSLIPMFTLGIPGSSVAAILLSGLIISGLQPGPRLFIYQGPYVYAIILSIFVSSIIFLLFGVTVSRYFAKLTAAPVELLGPLVICLAVIGAFSIRGSLYGVWITLIIGIVAYFMRSLDFPVAPILIGLILGPITESNLFRSLLMSQGSWLIFIQRPICVVFLLLTMASIIWTLRGLTILGK